MVTLSRYASSFHFFSAAIAQNPKCAKLYMLLGGEPLPYMVGGAIYYHTLYTVTLTHLEDHESARQSYEQAISLDRYASGMQYNTIITVEDNGPLRKIHRLQLLPVRQI